MGGVLHGGARTTPRVRAPNSKRRKGAAVPLLRPLRAEPEDRRQVAQADHDIGCADGTARSEEHGAGRRPEEAIVVAFRQATMLLPLDDVLGCLRDTIPSLSRSALHRCLQRHGISPRLPVEETAGKRKRFKT